MYGVGRNNPRVRAALVEALALETPGMLAMGTTLLPGLLAEALIGARRRPDRALPVHELRHRGGRGGAQARARSDRAARAFSPPTHGFHGLTLGSLSANGNGSSRSASSRCCRALSRCRSAISTRSRRSCDARTSRSSSSSRCRARGSTCLAERLPRGGAGAVPPPRDALLRRRGDDRVRADRPHVRVPALGAGTGSGDGGQDAVRRLRPVGRAADGALGARGGLRLDAACDVARLDVRTERARDGGRARDAARAARVEVSSSRAPDSASGCSS